MAAMLHDRNNRFFFLWEQNNVLSNAKHYHCSCHAIWLPCKTSIGGDLAMWITRINELKKSICELLRGE